MVVYGIFKRRNVKMPRECKQVERMRPSHQSFVIGVLTEVKLDERCVHVIALVRKVPRNSGCYTCE